MHPGDPYEALRCCGQHRRSASAGRMLVEHRPVDRRRATSAAPAPPPQEALPRWRRIAEGFRHSRISGRRGAIHHHYDVSNTFYEYGARPVDDHTPARASPDADATLEEAQDNKYRLVFEKLRLRRATGCSTWAAAGAAWSATPPRNGVRAIGVTLSAEQAAWAQRKIADEGSPTSPKSATATTATSASRDSTRCPRSA